MEVTLDKVLELVNLDFPVFKGVKTVELIDEDICVDPKFVNKVVVDTQYGQPQAYAYQNRDVTFDDKEVQDIYLNLLSTKVCEFRVCWLGDEKGLLVSFNQVNHDWLPFTDEAVQSVLVQDV
jgi:hypothetical protein